MDLALLADWVVDARRRTEELYADLSDAQLAVPYLRIINPPIWELGHVAWFQEHWVLRHALGATPARADADALWDSFKVAHATRWDLPLPSRAETLEYLEAVRERVLRALRAAGAALSDELRYFVLLSVFHEDMHGEAFAYTRQTLGLRAPRLTHTAGEAAAQRRDAGPLAGDVTVPGGIWRLGAEPEPKPLFVFDNEKWAHEVEVSPFHIARAPVTQAEFAAFVDDGGYRRRDLWSEQGWAWREDARAVQPLYWRRGARGSWERRVFDRWVALEPHRPVLHVCAHEAEAFCRWAGRRLPTEAEWEMAAAGEPAVPHRDRAALLRRKRTYPWGEESPDGTHANVNFEIGDTVDVGALPQGDSAFGCRQMLGNVWEWTASTFLPYPGFSVDPYKEYSEPWFGDHRVLRGGCFVTRGRLLRNSWRNFYAPDRRDVWAGFRTCDAKSAS